MSTDPTAHVARVVLPCADLDAELAFFARLGFAVQAIWPADDPRTAIVAAHGLSLELTRTESTSPGVSPGVSPPTIHLACADPSAQAARWGAESRTLVAPSGARLTVVDAEPPLILPDPAPSLAVSRSDAGWVVGRAGMAYRELLPGRQGGRFIASQIRIAAGGPVSDWVHHHAIRLQLVYCHRGWVRVVYEDQGPPFVMHPGDCVLQPPHIRHRVLESSDGLEVVELACPAEHLTRSDPAVTLPTEHVRPDRVFGGQRFVRHVAAAAASRPWRFPGFSARDTGIAAATDGLADVRVVRAEPGAPPLAYAHDGELAFLFVCAGALAVDGPGVAGELAADSAIALPAGVAYRLTASEGLELLEVRVGARG